jgi:hypothetical protein
MDLPPHYDTELCDYVDAQRWADALYSSDPEIARIADLQLQFITGERLVWRGGPDGGWKWESIDNFTLDD